jgi:phenylpyruvate tautomerase PptA (4-oxalocrotonate tautomerase family)
MPLYQCLVPSGSLDSGARARIAKAITDVHTSVTGAPRGFVNVVFTDTSRPRTSRQVSPTRRR